MPFNAIVARSRSVKPSAVRLVVAEIEFAEITLQVSLRDVVIDAIDTALED
jgi:hypothetical protein